MPGEADPFLGEALVVEEIPDLRRGDGGAPEAGAARAQRHAAVHGLVNAERQVQSQRDAPGVAVVEPAAPGRIEPQGRRRGDAAGLDRVAEAQDHVPTEEAVADEPCPGALVAGRGEEHGVPADENPSSGLEARGQVVIEHAARLEGYALVEEAVLKTGLIEEAFRLVDVDHEHVGSPLASFAEGKSDLEHEGEAADPARGVAELALGVHLARLEQRFGDHHGRRHVARARDLDRLKEEAGLGPGRRNRGGRRADRRGGIHGEERRAEDARRGRDRPASRHGWRLSEQFRCQPVDSPAPARQGEGDVHGRGRPSVFSDAPLSSTKG